MATADDQSAEPPPGGWDFPREEAAARADVLTQLSDAAQGVRAGGAAAAVAEAMRELLVALRALIDWLVERLERRPGGPVEVRDIPVL